MPKYTVSSGDSIPSIAKEHGFLWKTIWDHPQNAGLKNLRKDPSVLFEGDEVFVPELELKEVSKSTDQKHTFKRKGDPVKLRIRLTKFSKPRANEKYILLIDGKSLEGTTDGDGRIEQTVPGNARTGTLILKGGKEQYPVNIGELDPLDEPKGIQQRLNNLGYDCGPDDGDIGEKTVEALKKFQAAHDLPATGEPDAATKAKFKEVHR